MKNRNLHILVLVFLAVIVSSCSKTKDKQTDENYFIRARVNNQLIEFNQTAISNTSRQTISGTAFRNQQDNFPFFSFDIESENVLSTGNWKENNPTYIMIFRYGLGADELFHSQMGEEEDFQFTITTNSAEIVEGNFQGTIRNAYNSSQAINITEGSFRLKVVQ